MKYTLTLIVFILSVSLYAQPIQVLTGENHSLLKKSTVEGFEFVLNTNEINFLKVKTEKGIFYKALSDGFTPTLSSGMPELLSYNRLIEVPAGAEIRIEVVKSNEITLDLSNYNVSTYLLPHQPSLEKKEGATADFQFNKSEYQKDRFYSHPIAKVEYLGLMRNINLARLSISPFSYNPVTNQLRVTKQIKVKVIFENGDIEETTRMKQKYYSPAFQLSESELLNGKAFTLIPPIPSSYAETMLIVSDSLFQSTLQPFIAMKKRQGFRIIEAYTQNPSVGNTKSSIKGYVQSLYNSGTANNLAPTYVLLVGDVSKIPSYTGIAASSHVTDLYYFEYTGDDFPELLYGRFSCDDTTELHNIIAKTMEYEQYLMPDPSYLDTSVLIAGYDATHGSTYGNGQVNYGAANYYNIPHGIISKTYLFPSSSSQASQIKADAVRGLLF